MRNFQLAASIAASDSTLDAMRVSEDSRSRIVAYFRLFEDGSIARLASEANRDLSATAGQAAVLIKQMQLVAVRRKMAADVLRGLRRAEKSHIDNAKLQPAESQGSVLEQLTDPRTRFPAVANLARRSMLPSGAGKIVFRSAENLAARHAASLRFAAYAEFSRVHTLIGSRQGDALLNPQLGDSELARLDKSLRGISGQFARKERAVYQALLNRSAGKRAALRDLLDWSAANVSLLASVQAVALFYATRLDGRAKKDLHDLAIKLAFRASGLSRKVAATSQASLMALLDLGGIGLSPAVRETLLAVDRLPLRGRIHRGKKAAVARIAELPLGLFVRAEGTLTDLKHEKLGDHFVFSAKLQSFDRLSSVKITGKANSPLGGVTEGSFVRVSANIIESKIKSGNINSLEIETVDVSKTYARDIWIVAFRNIATRYIEQWPQNLHLYYVDQPSKISGDNFFDIFGSEFKTSKDCSAEWKAYIHAAKAHDLARSNSFWAGVAVFTMEIGAAAACLFTPFTAGVAIVLCLTSIVGFWGAIEQFENALQQEQLALEDLNDAQKAWEDCAYPPPSPIDPPNGGFGAVGGGFMDSPGEDMPDWIANGDYGEPDWSGWDGPDPDPDPDPGPGQDDEFWDDLEDELFGDDEGSFDDDGEASGPYV